MRDSGVCVCMSLSQIPQALVNQDQNTPIPSSSPPPPFDPVIVSLRTAKLNGKVWFSLQQRGLEGRRHISIVVSAEDCCREPSAQEGVGKELGLCTDGLRSYCRYFRCDTDTIGYTLPDLFKRCCKSRPRCVRQVQINQCFSCAESSVREICP